jgi:hypothetical protein
MTKPIVLGNSSVVRPLSEEAAIQLVNRYFEENPTNQETQVALLTRPGFRKWLTIGSNPIDQIYTQPGSFNDSLFIASGGSLFRVDKDETVTNVANGIFNTQFGASGRVAVKMVATAAIGSTPEYLWIADGKNLWLYANSAQASGTLTSTGVVNNAETVVINGVYYAFTNASVNAGTPAGTVANPWLVARGANNITALAALKKAINLTGIAGTDYSTGTVLHPTVYADDDYTVTFMRVYAKVSGIGGNANATSETMANASWGGAFLSGGGLPQVTEVLVPDGGGAIDVAFIAGYVIVVIGEGYGVNGRFYWVEPGDTFIDALNFATAERAPDPLYSVKVIGDQFWLFGTNTTEIWYPTGDALAPFQRLQGRLFDRGIWQGTDIRIKDQVMVVDTDGVVYAIGGSPVRVSNNGIEERIRKAIAKQKVRTG